MKKLLFVLLLCLITSKINAQFHKLIDTNKLWNYYDVYAGPPPHYTQLYRFTKDTIILEKKYYISEITQDSINWIKMNYYLREDSAKRVYVLYNNIEGLLYDFGIADEDSVTITNTPFSLTPHTWKVSLIDSVQIDNHYRKVIHFVNQEWHAWIEGIGDTYGMLYFGPPLTGNALNIVCYYENDSLKYANPIYNSCFHAFLGIEEERNKSFTISPNPFSTSTQISFDKTYPTIALSLYDLQGKLLLQNHYADCNQITLHRNQLSNGLYFLKLIIDDKQIETRKIVISD